MVEGGAILFLLASGVCIPQVSPRGSRSATLEPPEWEERVPGPALDDGIFLRMKPMALDEPEDLPSSDVFSKLGLRLQGPAQEGESGVTLNFAGHARYSFPFGTADRNHFVYGNGLVIVDHSISWADLFNAGWGFDVEMDLYIEGRGLASGPRAGPSAGLAFLFELNDFGGAHLADSSGGDIKLDNLTTTALLLGGVVFQPLGHGAYTKGVIAVGGVRYASVNGTFSGPGGQFKDEVFQSTWTITSDLRAMVGYRIGSLGISFGVGVRIQGPPTEGPRVSLNSGAFWIFDLNLGLDVGF